MKLYIYEHCPFCTRARMIFGLKNLPVELHVIMEGDAETPIALIGRKALPILCKEDKSHIGESLDIVRYLDSIGTPLLTGADSPSIDAWCEEAWKPALKPFVPRFTESTFGELATTEARDAYRAREEKAFGDLDVLRAQTPKLVAEMNLQLQELAKLLTRHTDLGYSDIRLWPLLRSLSIVKDLQFPEPVRDYMGRLEWASKVPLLFVQAI